MMRYDYLARQRQQEMLREAEMGRLRKTANEARRVHPVSPEPRRDTIARRP
jgi:hypothetical protein